MRKHLGTVSVVDAATARLRESLFSGEYEAGQEIKDTQIAEDFGIARPTARIAVQQLINEGVLVRPPGFSARVRIFDPGQVRDLYRARRLIELDAIQFIKSNKISLHLVEAALHGFAGLQRDDDWGSISEADVNFHAAVVSSSGSPRLQSYFTEIMGETRLLIALLKAQYQGGEPLYQEHKRLFELLGAGGTMAELIEAWTAHLGSAQAFLEKLLATPEAR